MQLWHFFFRYNILSLALIGKSWQTQPKTFPRFHFPGHELGHISWKFIPSSILEFWGMTQALFYWKTHPYLNDRITGKLNQIYGLAHDHKIWITKKWMSFPIIRSNSWPGKLKFWKKILDEFFSICQQGFQLRKACSKNSESIVFLVLNFSTASFESVKELSLHFFFLFLSND